ncbi:probable purine permease 5 isoform X2 [Spinacia oleracea]|uniref:Probable purine permease n=1 Tax=Spinacia oleracea TaxID=3562 RepID=A0A9R0KCT5_SPIOL|nr:probable purine permease 5 isoform X2 [Spinacia oleracea]
MGHLWDQMANQEASVRQDDYLRVSILGDTTTDTNSSSSKTIRHHISDLKMMLVELYRGKPFSFWILLLLSGGAMLIAFPASSLLSRLYYSNGGKSKWILSWVAVAGWPLTALALLPTYIFCNTYPTRLNLKLTISYAVVGFLSAADNLLYAYAYAYLPASTASLLASSSLIFSALFGYLLVGNRINASIINSVVMITAALTIIALDSDSDLYGNVSKTQYTMGFVYDILGSALHGLIFALSELLFVKLLGRTSFHVVLEQHVMVSLFAFTFTTVGLVVGRSFQGMEEEARNFKGGITSYSMVLVWSAITFQLGVLGATGVLFLASTMLAGVLNAVRVPLTSIAAVILLRDPMSGFKILSLVITFWGFCSYIYGSRPSKNDHSTTSF